MIVDASGLAFCIYSNKPVSYGSFVKKIFLIMPKINLIFSAMKKIIVTRLVCLFLGVNHPHHPN